MIKWNVKSLFTNKLISTRGPPNVQVYKIHRNTADHWKMSTCITPGLFTWFAVLLTLKLCPVYPPSCAGDDAITGLRKSSTEKYN